MCKESEQNPPVIGNFEKTPFALAGDLSQYDAIRKPLFCGLNLTKLTLI